MCVQPVVAMVEHIIGAPYDVYQWGPPVPPCNDSRLKVRHCIIQLTLAVCWQRAERA